MIPIIIFKNAALGILLTLGFVFLCTIAEHYVPTSTKDENIIFFIFYIFTGIYISCKIFIEIKKHIK